MNSLEKEFVPYQESLELKELGFDEPCFSYYKNGQPSDVLESVKNSEMKNVNNEVDNYITAPTFSQAFRFFREKYKIGTWIHHYFNMDKGNFEYSWAITLPYKDDGYVYDTYEEAELSCLRKLIEIVKNNKL
jgi:hypothetical protein